jgi:hypothetical protein
MNLASLIAAMLLVCPAVATAGGWYLLAPGIADVLVRTQKNVGLGDIPVNEWQTMEVFDTASECKARRQALMDRVPNPGPTAPDLIVAGWARLQASECIASDDPRLSRPR